LAATALITALSVWLIVERAVVATSLGDMFLGEDPNWQIYRERIRTFASDEFILVALEDVDPLAPDTLDRLQRAVDRVKELDEECPPNPAAAPTPASRIETTDFEEDADETPEASFKEGRCALIRRVDSVLTAQRITSSTDAQGIRQLQIAKYAHESREHPEQRNALLDALKADPILGHGSLVSHNGKHIAVLFEIMPNDIRPAEFGPKLLHDIEQALADEGFARDKQHVVGFIAILSEAFDQSNYTLATIFPYVALVLLLVVYLMFRRLWPVLLSLGVSLIAVIWTVGFSVLLDPKISLMHSMVPAVVLIVGFSDVIHLCSAYLIELGRDPEDSKDKAILLSCTDVGRACVYTSMTTFVGFLGLSFIPTPVFRLLGVILGFGVGVALLLAVTLVPIVFTMMPRPKPWRVGITEKVQARVDGFMRGIAYLTTRHPWWVIGAFAVVLAVSVWGINRLYIESALTDNFEETSKVQQDAAFFQEHFIRSNSIDLFVTAEQPKALYLPEVSQKVLEFERKAERQEGVEWLRSYADLIEQIHGHMTQGMADQGPWPASQQQVSQYMEAFGENGGDGLDRTLDPTRTKALVSVRIANEGARKAHVTGDELVHQLQTDLGEGYSVEASGVIYVLGGWVDVIIDSQARGLMVVFLIISLMMAVGLRSLRSGLVSMLPNAFPLLVLGGTLGLVYDEVDSDTLFLAMLAVGIGVDDTIHFLMRYRLERSRNVDKIVALERTFEFAGRAIIMTTVTLAVGFAPFALSGYFSIWILGVYLPLTLVVALLADLFLVPAMAQVGWVRFRKTDAV